MLSLRSAPLLQRNHGRERTSVASIANWFVFGALITLLTRCFGEIVFCLSQTSMFKPLSVLLPLVALPLACQITTKLLGPDRSDINSSGLHFGRTIWALLLLSVVTAALAVLTARRFKSTYNFTPLLRVAALLMNELWR
jgi:hypothetical protein